MIKSFILSISMLLTLPALAQMYTQPTDCRDRIAQIVCLVDPVDSSMPDRNFIKRPCMPGSEHYAEVFERHFDRSPDVIKNMYCHLNRVFIEVQFGGTAFASPVTDASGRSEERRVGEECWCGGV